MVIGIPRALLYYRYNTLWESFFHELCFQTVTSGITNQSILEQGRIFVVDEACLSMKIFMGHVASLIGKCDYLFIPRIESLDPHEKVCTNFMALYDLVHNLFPDVALLSYNIDVKHHDGELLAFLNLGKQLGKSKLEVLRAYQKAKEIEEQKHLNLIDYQKVLLKQDQLKILLVGHAYNLHDKLIGGPISDYLKKEQVCVLYSDRYDRNRTDEDVDHLSKDIYWTFNREVLASLWYHHKKVDGIILVTTFPCGPDSLANEMCLRKIKDVPITNIIIDELNSEAGLITRLESFIDIIKERKASRYETRSR